MTSPNGSHRQTITALVRDKPGVLNRVSSMFRRRGFNIASLAVGHSEVPELSRMTFVVEGDDHTVEQVTKNLHKLIDVIRVTSVDPQNVVARELALIKLRTDDESRPAVIQTVEIFQGRIVGVAPDHVIIEMTGDQNKIESFLGLVKRYGVLEVMRTGSIVMERWMGSLHGRPGDTGARSRRHWGEAASV